MSEVGEFVARAWSAGVGADDRAAIAAITPGADDPDRATFELFAALGELMAYAPAPIPAAPHEPATAVVHAAASVLDAIRARDRSAIDRAVVAVAARLAGLPADHPHARSAVAWADLALGEVALVVGELRVARLRFETVAAHERPIALRIVAMFQLVALAIERADIEAARTWVRKAAALAPDRPRDAARARLLGGLIDYATADLAAMQASLGRDGARDRAREGARDGAIAQLLLATAEPTGRAMARFADLLGDAVDQRDPLLYALCILLGARRYRAIGCDTDARLTLDAGIEQLANVAPSLANLLAEERATWPPTEVPKPT